MRRGRRWGELSASSWLMFAKKSFKRRAFLCVGIKTPSKLRTYWRMPQVIQVSFNDFFRKKKGTVHLICNLATSKTSESMKRTWFGSEILLNVNLFLFLYARKQNLTLLISPCAQTSVYLLDHLMKGNKHRKTWNQQNVISSFWKKKKMKWNEMKAMLRRALVSK